MRAAARLLRAEATKLLSVPRWRLTLAAAAVLPVLAGLLLSSGFREDDDDTSTPYAPTSQFRDEGHAVAQEVGEEAELVARVTRQDGSHPWARAGLVIRADDTPGSSYAALMVTPEHGVRLQSDFDLDTPGSDTAAPVWLRLTRAGTRVTADESPDGEDWRPVGTVDLPDLDGPAQLGLFVASPDAVRVERNFTGESVAAEGTDGTATFDDIHLRGATDPERGWRERDRSRDNGQASEDDDGRVTITGGGDLGRYDYADDPTRVVLSRALLGVMVLLGLAVVSVTSEYRLGTLRTSFLAHPDRAAVLLAKAGVVAAAAFAVGLLGAAGAVVASTPVLTADGLTPLEPNPAVLRAVVGTAALAACLAVFALGLAAALRRTAPALAVAVTLTLVPQVAATGLPLPVAMWVERLTPAAGFAVQQTVQRYDTALPPVAGLAVAAGYAAVALFAGAVVWTRRDV